MEKKTLKELEKRADRVIKKEFSEYSYASLDEYKMMNDYDGDYYEELVFRVGVEDAWQEIIEVFYESDMSADFVVGMMMGQLVERRK